MLDDPLRRACRTFRGHGCAALPARAGSTRARSGPAEPHVEIVEHDGLRWINIERPGPLDQAWLEEHFEFHPLDYEDVRSRNQRPKIDEYDDYLFIVLHFPVFDKQVGRLNAGELDIFIGPDYLITMPERAAAAGRVPVRALPHQRGASASELFSKGPGYLLYKIVDDSFDYCFPMLRKIGNKLERLEEEIFEGARRGRRARHLERQAGDHQLPQDHPPAAHGAARPRAHQAALPRPTTSRSTSTTSSTPPSASGTCSRTTRRSSRRSRTRTSR